MLGLLRYTEFKVTTTVLMMRGRRRQSTDYRTANASTTAKGEGLLKRKQGTVHNPATPT